MSPQGRTRRASLAAIVAVPVVIALLLTLFAWPQARLQPRGLPIGVAGPQRAVGAIEQRLAQSKDAFEIHRYAGEEAARQAIEDREIYGAFVAAPDGFTLLTASAASPAVAQLLEQRLASPAARILDVVPADRDDPRGAALTASLLPLLLAGLLVGSLAPPGLPQEAGLLVVASVSTGLAAVGVAQAWLGIIGGSWAANAAVLSLMVLAIGAVAAGATALLGRAGLVLAAVLMLLLGNPWSGISSPPELLPRPIGDIGQLLPPGAGASGLRGTAFFDGAGSGRPLLVLAAWALAGLAAMTGAALLGRRRNRAGDGDATRPPPVRAA